MKTLTPEPQRDDTRESIIAELWKCDGARSFSWRRAGIFRIFSTPSGQWFATNAKNDLEDLADCPYFNTQAQALSAINQVGEDRLNVLLAAGAA